MRNTNARILALGGTLMVMLAAGATPAIAQSFDGQWTASQQFNGMTCNFQLVMNAGRYSELLQCGPYMTMQSGAYVYQNGVLARTVLDFEPKQRPIIQGGPLAQTGPNGRRYLPGPRVHYEANATPPGGTYRVTFLAGNAMNWHDLNLGGNITFYRAR